MHFQSEAVMHEIQVIIHLVEDVDMLSDDARMWISGRLLNVKCLFDVPGMEQLLREHFGKNLMR